MIYITLLLSFVTCVISGVVTDSNGYLLYCPCIGRFGTQSEHLLNALAFSKGINRTLVVPPWILYKYDATSMHVQYENWFSIDELTKFHKVVSFTYFKEHIADTIWPLNNRTGQCRVFVAEACEMEYGNPFGTFWEMHDIVFTRFVLHYNGQWDTLYNPDAASHWLSMYPPDVPVLAFRRPPGREASSDERIEKLQKYVQFTETIQNATKNLLWRKNVGFDRILAVQLLSDTLLDSICSDNSSFQYGNFFSTNQCKGDGFPLHGITNFTYEMCNPPQRDVVKLITKYLNTTKASTLFISTDYDRDTNVVGVIEKLKKSFGDKVEFWVRSSYVLHLSRKELMIDLQIMSEAQFFIGNCVDEFSAFVRRQRKVSKKPFAYIASQNTTTSK